MSASIPTMVERSIGMESKKHQKIAKNLLIMICVFVAAILVCSVLSNFLDASNPFAVSIFILAVVLIARFTDGYLYGVVASGISVFCVNYMFTYPFWEFNMSISGYPPTFAVMLLVSLIVSTLTTQIKKQEQLRYEMEKEKMRGNLLRSVSHDIRTPLTSILGASSLLMQDSALSEYERKDLLKEINKDAQWLVRITENILSVTKFTGEGVSLKKDSEAIEEILGSAIAKFRKSYGSIPISVSKPDKVLLVDMDATLIEQVLINLFENVVIHGETATRIDVKIVCEDDRVIFSIDDDGAGFPPQVLPHAFDGYIHGNSKCPSDDRRDMGIGLSVCQSIIRAHGGNISARNNERGGASICFWLPYEDHDDEY